jgi:hypothetical protein
MEAKQVEKSFLTLARKIKPRGVATYVCFAFVLSVPLLPGCIS